MASFDWQPLEELRERSPWWDSASALPEVDEVAGLVCVTTACCCGASYALRAPLARVLGPLGLGGRAAAAYGAAVAAAASGGALALAPRCRALGRRVGRRALGRAAAWLPLAVATAPILAVIAVDARVSRLVLGEDTGHDLDGGTLLSRAAFGAAVPFLLAFSIGYAAFNALRPGRGPDAPGSDEPPVFLEAPPSSDPLLTGLTEIPGAVRIRGQEGDPDIWVLDDD